MPVPVFGSVPRKMRGSQGRRLKSEPTIINIPIPKINETELEVVHVFPQGYPGGSGGYGGYGGSGGYGGYGSEPYMGYIPSYSVITTVNGTESTNNFWGYNPTASSSKGWRL